MLLVRTNIFKNIFFMNKMSVILIPYRDRQSHLDYFIDNTVPILKKYPEISKVVVIEQGNQKLFNHLARVLVPQ